MQPLIGWYAIWSPWGSPQQNVQHQATRWSLATLVALANTSYFMAITTYSQLIRLIFGTVIPSLPFLNIQTREKSFADAVLRMIKAS